MIRKSQQQKRCECTKLVYYTIELVFFMLVVRVTELVVQEDLLKVDNLNLSDAEKQCVIKETAKIVRRILLVILLVKSSQKS